MFADPLDNAQHTIEQTTENAVAERRRAAAPEQVQNPDGSWPVTECADCGEDIEEGRLALARIRCFKCQSALEIRRKQYAVG